jgi:hypothetical protein
MAKHRKCGDALRTLRNKQGAEAFDEEFFQCMACVLPIYVRAHTRAP